MEKRLAIREPFVRGRNEFTTAGDRKPLLPDQLPEFIRVIASVNGGRMLGILPAAARQTNSSSSYSPRCAGAMGDPQPPIRAALTNSRALLIRGAEPARSSTHQAAS
jgi:hypothetical protein